MPMSVNLALEFVDFNITLDVCVLLILASKYFSICMYVLYIYIYILISDVQRATRSDKRLTMNDVRCTMEKQRR